IAPEINEDGTVDTKSLLIQVYNGGNISGLAKKYTDKLAADGYRLGEPDTYRDAQTPHTRILVKESGIGTDLTGYFKDARIEVAPEAVGDADIRIILGTEES
ncbi:MAG: LytR C-terminal domain-containing protein, partial [Bacillota bacterium]|nr:LytR C-terminal domain-containing protein [Bacillota bacterium]